MKPQSSAILAVFMLAASACGGGAQGAPLSPINPSSTTKGFNGTTVSAIDGQPIPSVTVKIGNRTVVSDANGAFHVDNLSEGNQPAILSSSAVVERSTTVVATPSEPLRETLIPSSFDLVAFDQMFRGTDQLQRWTTAPSLVVLTTVMNYENGFGQQDDYHATSEQLTDAETTILINQLTEALATLTGNTFTAFASVERESAASGAKVKTLRSGKIVVGRYNGIQGLLNTIGFGRWASDGHGQVNGGAVFLDRDFDKSNEQRRLLRTHELGHALGYLHVTSRTSIMNPAVGPDVTVFDREGAIVAFQRQPGNRSPDIDATAPVSSGPGGLFGFRPIPAVSIWGPAIP